jgi:hypothetical protein
MEVHRLPDGVADAPQSNLPLMVRWLGVCVLRGQSGESNPTRDGK